jgi:O-glycosyl hydrolase
MLFRSLATTLVAVFLLVARGSFAQGPPPTPVPPAPVSVSEVTLHPADVRQPIYGFGGTLTFSGDAVASFPSRSAVYRELFQDLNMDILRVRNYDGYGGQQGAYEKITKEFVTAARRFSDPSKRNGKSPVRIMFTSWSPPGDLKSTGSPDGSSEATLAQGTDGKFVYGGFADWWLQSIEHFKQLCGVYPDYIALQNEPDVWVTYPGCHFLPVEGAAADGTPIAGYDQALATVSAKLTAGLGANVPKIIGPETSSISIGPDGLSDPVSYVNPATPIGQTDLSHLFGVSYHLYASGVDSGHIDLDRFEKNLAALPAAYRSGSVAKPMFETEYLGGDTMTEVASMIHDCFTIGGAAPIWSGSPPATRRTRAIRSYTSIRSRVWSSGASDSTQ